MVAPCQDPSAGSRRGSDARSNRSAFSTAGYGADDCAEQSPAANVFSGAFIGSDTFFALGIDDIVRCVNAISLPVDDYGIQVNRYLTV